MSELPFQTADLPGCGGLVKAVPEDFRVDELPAYLPCGDGEHLYVRIEKEGRTTEEVRRALAHALRVNEREVGVAGQKDRQAITTQWMSVAGASAAAAEELAGDGWRVLEVALHRNKLRVGHLRGNRFEVRIRGVPPALLPNARAIAARLTERGLANFYGEQRFGRAGDNAELGRLLLTGARDPRVDRAHRDRFLRKLLISAFQSAVFNEVLCRRIAAGTVATPLLGDVLQKLPSGGLFVCADPAEDAPRVTSFACAVTGPMPGGEMRPAPSGEPAQLEDEVLAATGVDPAQLRRSRLAQGARRALRIPLTLELREAPEALELAFELPPGSYATVVLREFTRGP